MERVILVDDNDSEIGTMEKLEAHKNGGTLHRAFSILVFDSSGSNTLLQLRARSKYHAGGLWTNTTCSHPRPGEETLAAAHRRLKEEMGFDTELRDVFSFIYRADVGGGLTEYEYDHVFCGVYEGSVAPNPDEADGYAWVSWDFFKDDVVRRPQLYTPWFREIMKQAGEIDDWIAKYVG